MGRGHEVKMKDWRRTGKLIHSDDGVQHLGLRGFLDAVHRPKTQ
jgi:hypothetical protein